MSRGLTYKAVAVFTIALSFVSPVFVQAQQTQSQIANTPRAAVEPDAFSRNSSRLWPGPARQVTLGTDYSSGKRWLPNPIALHPLANAEPPLTNSPRIGQLLRAWQADAES